MANKRSRSSSMDSDQQLHPRERKVAHFIDWSVFGNKNTEEAIKAEDDNSEQNKNTQSRTAAVVEELVSDRTKLIEARIAAVSNELTTAKNELKNLRNQKGDINATLAKLQVWDEEVTNCAQAAEGVLKMDVEKYLDAVHRQCSLVKRLKYALTNRDNSH